MSPLFFSREGAVQILTGMTTLAGGEFVIKQLLLESYRKKGSSGWLNITIFTKK